MKEDIKNRWVHALRSGKYKQGLGNLRDTNDAYCCLGVLCDILKEEVSLEWKKAQSPQFYTIGDACNVLPLQIGKYVNIDAGGRVDNEISLWKLNDFYLKSFNEIADYIEQNSDKIMPYQEVEVIF